MQSGSCVTGRALAPLAGAHATPNLETTLFHGAAPTNATTL